MQKKNFIGFRDRVLLHLLKYEKDVYENIHGNDVDGNYRNFLGNLTQEGIASNVGTKQSTIYKELKTLNEPTQNDDEPLIDVIDKVRIPGRERACAIYYLTPYGQDLASQKRSYIENKNIDVHNLNGSSQVITIGELSNKIIDKKITNNLIEALLIIASEVSADGKIDWNNIINPSAVVSAAEEKQVTVSVTEPKKIDKTKKTDIKNPYFNRIAIKDPKHFIGRQEEVKYIFSLLRNTQSCSIVGPRRIGKSSLINYVSNKSILQAHGLNPDDFIFVPIDLEGLAELTQTDFFSMILEEIRNSITEETLRKKMVQVLANEQIRFLDLKNILKEISAKEKNVIFLFDEFELITSNKNLDLNFFSGLRNLANTYNVAYITASNSPLLELTFSRETLGSPFFNFFTQIDLGLMSDVEVDEMLSKPLTIEENNIEFTSDIIDHIKSTAGSHPFFIQILCFHIYNRMVENEVITDQDLQEITQRYYKDAKPHFRYFWNHLTEPDQNTLIDLIKSGGSFDYNKNKAQIDRLVKRALLQKTNTGYRIFSKSFIDFIVSIANLPEYIIKPTVQEQPKSEPIKQPTLDEKPRELDISWGNIYFADEDSPELTTWFFTELTKQGIAGLFITRTHPEKAKTNWKLNDDNILWLCSRTGPGFIRPALEKISHTIFEFVNNNPKSIVLLDGVEYIVNNNDFLKTLNLMDSLKEVIAVNNAILVFPISSKIFSEKEMALLKKDSTQLSKQSKLNLASINI